MESMELYNEIQEKIQYIEKQISLIKDGEITPESLNNALANYYTINNFLITQYELISLEDESLKDEYKLLWSEWFMEIKNELIEKKLTSKFPSQTEIEAQALLKHKDDYKIWRQKLRDSERKVSFYRRLLEGWKTQANMLVNLSQNMRSELSALSIENSANKHINKEKVIRKIKKSPNYVYNNDIEE